MSEDLRTAGQLVFIAATAGVLFIVASVAIAIGVGLGVHIFVLLH